MIHATKFALGRMVKMLGYGLWGPPLIIVFVMLSQQYKSSVDPLKNWFMPVHLHVPDFCVGDDPIVYYDRLIRRQFEMSYHSQYVSVDDNGTATPVDDQLGFPFCEHSSPVFAYYPKGTIRATPKLSEFMGGFCSVPAGTYRAETTWQPVRPGYLPETTSLVSNIFHVYPTKSSACVEMNKE